MKNNCLIFGICTLGLCVFFSTLHTQELNIDQKNLLTKEQALSITFTPPPGWFQADTKDLSPNVKAMVFGKGSFEFPPSMNLSMEEFHGSLKDYLNLIKEINRSQGSEWKDLGSIKTLAGEASLSQTDTMTEWGAIRMMHVVLSKDGMIYILTASALAKEFSKFHKIFFNSLRSLQIHQQPMQIAMGYRVENYGS